MKNLKLLFYLLIFGVILSCVTESDELTPKEDQLISNEDNEIAPLNFYYKNQTYTLKFKINTNVENKNQTEQIIPIKDASFDFIKELDEKSETLISYMINKDNYILFENDNEFSSYLAKTKKSLSGKSNSYTTPYDDPTSLEIFTNSNYNSKIYWWTDNDINGYGGSSACYFRYVDNENRLKHFNSSANWTVHQTNSVTVCFSNAPFGNNPNDKMSSLKVKDCLARFYEHSYYGGRSLVIDARTTINPLVIANLHDYRMTWRRTWNDDISSVKLTY
ncbi:hypothetical protein [Hyunsoonleella ulvae]|uniref:hypothetical protein n=1 Tax=Hyunsoonleella ulvae TaxID=2799948 RepID=UPI0019394D1F|nr:hypothetical protein [Hyunsoonleella ulvae]